MSIAHIATFLDDVINGADMMHLSGVQGLLYPAPCWTIRLDCVPATYLRTLAALKYHARDALSAPAERRRQPPHMHQPRRRNDTGVPLTAVVSGPQLLVLCRVG